MARTPNPETVERAREAFTNNPDLGIIAAQKLVGGGSKAVLTRIRDEVRQENSPLKSILDLKEDVRNPRQISDSALLGLQVSEEEFGDISGIVWNKRSGVLVAGHQRMKALKQAASDREVELRLEQAGPDRYELILPASAGNAEQIFGVRVVDWPESKQLRANVAANNQAIGGLFTPDVQGILDELQALDEGLFDGLLLGEIEVPEMPDLEPGGSGLGDDDPPIDRAVELQKVWATELGQAWEVPSLTVPGRCHRVVCGDSLKDAAPTRDTLFFDPPWDVDTCRLKDWGAFKNILAFADGQRLADIIEKWGAPTWLFVWDCVTSWYAPNRPLKRMKLCAWYGDVQTYDFDGAHYGEPDVEKTVTNTRGSYTYKPDPRGKHLSDVFQMGITRAHADKRHKHSKPLEWIRMLLANCTQGDIYDPFLGSGAAIIAAEALGRIVHGSEIDPKNVAVILEYAKSNGLTPKKAN